MIGNSGCDFDALTELARFSVFHGRLNRLHRSMSLTPRFFDR